MNTTTDESPPALAFTQSEWIAFVEEEFYGHSRLEEIKSLCLMGFGNSNKIGHERVSEILTKAIQDFGPF